MSSRKKPPSPTHPIAKAIEDVLLAGHTPRIHVDARRADVTVPDHVRERWQARLVIDLDPSWPLRLEYGEDGLGVDLAFQGLVTRCVFGWKAIYVVLDRATGRGTVVEAQLPPHELPPGERVPSLEGEKEPRALGVVPNAAKPSAHTRPTLVPTEEPTPVPAPKRPRRSRDANAARVEIPPPPDAGSSGSEASSEEKARERRARFRVINGGG